MRVPGRPTLPAMLISSRRHAWHLFSRLRGVKLGEKVLNSAASSKVAASEAELPQFEAAASNRILFPELLKPGSRAVLVGVDPDIHGAVAVLSWQNGAAADSTGHMATEGLTLSVHDMPVEVWQQSMRNKRQPDAAALLAILQQHRAGEGAGAEAGVAGAEGGSVVIRAVLEHTTPQHLSGKYAWYGIGFSFGLLTGLLTSQDIQHQRVDAALWKRHMGLYRLGKEGSLLLARQLFPQAQQYLTRKKDHGRAEALLIAAWALGVRMLAPKAPAGALEQFETETEGEGQEEPDAAGNHGSIEAAPAAGEECSKNGTAALKGGRSDSPPTKRRSRKKAAADAGTSS